MNSDLLSRVVEEFSKLPSIGDRSALRLALYLLKQPESSAKALSNAIINFRQNIKFCSNCNNLSDTDICPICSDINRDRSVICIVEQVKDVLSIEATGGYSGVYFVLGGVISPMQGIAPSNLKIDLLLSNIEANRDLKEVIIALPTTIEGEMTTFYIKKKVSEYNIRVSTIARGVGFGDELDYTDEITLVHAINNRREL